MFTLASDDPSTEQGSQCTGQLRWPIGLIVLPGPGSGPQAARGQCSEPFGTNSPACMRRCTSAPAGLGLSWQCTRLRLWRLSGAAPRGACAQYFSTLRTRRRLALVPYPRRQSQPVSAGRLACRATSRSSGGTFRRFIVCYCMLL